LKKEERALLDAVRERAEQREEQERKRKEREKRKPFNLPAGQNAVALTLSPDGKYVIATISEPGAGAKNTIVPNYVTESAYTEDITGRTKVGDTQNRARFVIIDVETGETRNVDHGQRLPATPPVQRTELNATEAEQKQSAESKTTTESSPTQTKPQPAQPKDRDVQLSLLRWSDDGKNAVLMARSADNKDRWVMLLDAATAKTKVLASMHDDAWIDGPGAPTLGWLPDNSHVYFESEHDGFAHLYSVAITGGEPVQLTSGQFEVSDVQLSSDKTKFYFTSSEGSPFERHLYSMALSGGARTRITAAAFPGNHQVDVSPDETMLADVYSHTNAPPELYLLPMKTELEGVSSMREVTTSPFQSSLLPNGSIRPSSVSKRATARRCTGGCTCLPITRAAARRCCSCTAQAICRTFIAGGVPTIASTCSITC